VPLNKPVRDALEAWRRFADVDALGTLLQLFVGPQGRRLSARAVDLVIRRPDSARGADCANGSRDTIAGPRPRKRLK
jgi:hypothetical protein